MFKVNLSLKGCKIVFGEMCKLVIFYCLNQVNVYMVVIDKFVEVVYQKLLMGE